MSSMTGYFLLGSKLRGRQIMPQMSVLPSRPFATNTSGGSQPAVFNATHDILAFRDLVFDFAFLRIDQVEMPPAIALGHVNNFIGLLQPVDETQVQTLCVSGPDERLGCLVDEVADCAGLRIHFDHPKSLVAAVHLLVGKMAPVAIPVETRRFPFVL